VLFLQLVYSFCYSYVSSLCPSGDDGNGQQLVTQLVHTTVTTVGDPGVLRLKDNIL
jgi:hypothetical protein